MSLKLIKKNSVRTTKTPRETTKTPPFGRQKPREKRIYFLCRSCSNKRIKFLCRSKDEHMRKVSITKSNALIESSYRLSLNELRVILYGISFIDPTSSYFPDHYTINVAHFAKFFGIDAHERSFYKELKEAIVEKFWNRELGYWDEKNQKVIKERWLIRVEYSDSQGELSIHYNPLIRAQLQKLKGNFTTYGLENISQMKSVYAVRIYELCIMNLKRSQKSKATFSVNIEDLKRQFELEARYSRFYDLKMRVLEPARKGICKHSDVRMSYETIKSGRRPVEIAFTVNWKKRQEESVKISDREIEKLAYAGESWEQARERIKKRKGQETERCPHTADMFEEV